MKQHSLETTDIFRGAFFLCKGGDLCRIRIKDNGRRTATFLFTGPDLHSHDKAYINGHALVNPVQFREALNHLRDILFERIRDRERRYGNDRKGEDRRAQKEH
jgi:hypothetical protein